MYQQSIRCAIIGAGPIGLEAALKAAHLGLDVTVYEASESVAANVRDWGHVEMFSPFGMNRSSLGADAVSSGGRDLPEDEGYQRGSEFVASYLRPLAESPPLAGRVWCGVRVVCVGKEGLGKGDMIASSERLRRPFRLLLEDSGGRESVARADVVLDCTGLYDNPNWLGNGGIPAPGERALAERIEYGLPDVAGADRADYAANTTLLAGDGYSAATTLFSLLSLVEEEPQTRILWLTSGQEPRYEVIADDPLPRRAALIERANALAANGAPGLELVEGDFVEELAEDRDGRILVRVGGREIAVDRVVANVGFSPESSIYGELQVHECYASRGPMALSAALLGADAGADCLAVPSFGPETLKNPEPGFYILGSKSYGKGFNFLIKNGLEQVRDAFSLITGEPGLDLYAEKTRR